jgi:hypothetical protein
LENISIPLSSDPDFQLIVHTELRNDCRDRRVEGSAFDERFAIKTFISSAVSAAASIGITTRHKPIRASGEREVKGAGSTADPGLP